MEKKYSKNAIGSSIYMATVAPGLESVAESEVLAKVGGAWLCRTLRGRVLFGSSGTLAELMQLRCIDNLYAHAAWLNVGPHKADLRELAEVVGALDLGPALAHVDLGGRPRSRIAVSVSASRSGKHAYSRFDAAEAVLRALVERQGFRAGTEERHDVGFRLDVIGDDALLSVKLTPPEFRFRGAGRTFSAAALRPPVAHAIVWLSEPRPGDVFLDPFCGSGTIPCERAAYPAARILAGDISEVAVAAARRNAAALPSGSPAVEVSRLDARDLPVEEGTVTTIVTNPPWGNQIGPGEDMSGLYRSFLEEARRVLAPKGKIIVMSDQRTAVEGACRELGLACEALITVSLHGTTPAVYRIG